MHLIPTLAIGLLLASFVPAQTASYTTFGTGCPDPVGHVVPRVAVNTWGNSANAWTLGAANQRWQQQIDKSEMPTRPMQFFSLQWREDNANRTNPAHTLRLKILFGNTTYSSSTLTNNFGTNATGTQTVVFDGNMSLPAVPGGNQDLRKFHYVAKLTRPFLYVPLANQNFLIEIINSTTTRVARYTDVFSGSGTPGSRVYANNSTTALTGALGRNHMVVLSFGNTPATSGPTLSATGTPGLGKSFSVDLSGLTGTAAAGLIFGGSTSKWGAFNLPLDLTLAGAPGCSLLVSFDASIGLAVLNGTGSVKFTIPNQNSLLGLRFFNQFFVLDSAANTLGLIWSNGGNGLIGN